MFSWSSYHYLYFLAAWNNYTFHYDYPFWFSFSPSLQPFSNYNLQPFPLLPCYSLAQVRVSNFGKSLFDCLFEFLGNRFLKFFGFLVNWSIVCLNFSKVENLWQILSTIRQNLWFDCENLKNMFDSPLQFLQFKRNIVHLSLLVFGSYSLDPFLRYGLL